MSGARSRRKGANAERELAKRFAEAMPGADCKRGIGQARRGSEVADVEVPLLHVESKHGKRPNPRAAYAQACADAEENGRGKIPIAVVRDDRKAPFVVIGLDDFLWFVKDWWHHTNGRLVRRDQAAIEGRDAEASCAALDERDQGV
jgi:hypothetical protein